MKRAIVLGAAAALLACARTLPPDGHLVVYVDTDAVLPRPGTRPRADEPTALLDTVRIEVLAADGSLACGRCRRELAIDEPLVDAGASFTIVPDAAHAHAARLHVVGFRAEQAAVAGDRSAVEVWARLPEPPDTGARELTVELHVGEAGVPRGSLASPVELREGPPARPRAIFAAAMRASCTTAPPPGAVCVPGGTFWMGTTTDGGIRTILAPRLVSLSPFWLDAHEVTVAELRATAVRDGVRLSSGSVDGTHYEDFCTFTSASGPYEGYPANCTTFAAAEAVCAARGGALPTEAQFEYVESALVAQPFPWGRDHARCGDAVLARGPRSELFASEVGAFRRDCLPEPGGDPQLEMLGFPKPVVRPSLGRDVVVLPGGMIQDLAGNMTEWARDAWQPNDGPCWSSGALRIDPVCVEGERGLRTLKGAGWCATASGLPAWWREPHTAKPESSGISIGFRCAYRGR